MNKGILTSAGILDLIISFYNIISMVGFIELTE